MLNYNPAVRMRITQSVRTSKHIKVARVRGLPASVKLLVPAAFLLALCSIMTPLASEESTNETDADAEVESIVNGLLPAAVVRGQPIPRMTLAERMKYYNIPEVSIAFYKDGRVAWARGYGLADKTINKPVTPDTLFQAASISKSVTAFAALRLVQQGKLRLDDDVNLKLVSWKVPDNEFTKTEKVTLRRLLSHTAGMTVPSVGGYQAGEYMPTTVQVLNGEKTSNDPVRVDRVPGKEFRYSGGGYVVVQQILMDVTGKSFPALMRDLVFEPLGMTHSTFEAPLPKSLWPNAAQPYDEAHNGWYFYSAMAPAGLWTTPSDLCLFAIGIEKAYQGQSKFLSKELAREMLTHQSEEIYGLGVALGKRGHEVRFWHSGANGGYQSLFSAAPNLGEGFAVMTDGAGGLRLIGELQRAVAEEYKWPDGRVEVHSLVHVDPAVLRTYTGTYLFNGLFRLEVTLDNDQLYLQYGPFGDTPQKLFSESETKFFMTSVPFVVDFQRGPDGSVKRAKAQNGPEELDGEKIAEVKP
jgi:CubicO group peptidase (beta-lactamase class C family)